MFSSLFPPPSLPAVAAVWGFLARRGAERPWRTPRWAVGLLRQFRQLPPGGATTQTPLLGVTVPTVAARGRLGPEFWGRKPRGRQEGLNPSWTNDVFGITVIISNKQ